jgi:hypothetical protein
VDIVNSEEVFEQAMPVKLYVSRDSGGHEWPPDHSHEAREAFSANNRLWMVFNVQEALFETVANLRRPSADFVIISELGLGLAPWLPDSLLRDAIEIAERWPSSYDEQFGELDQS